MAEKIDLNTLPKGLTKEEFTALPNFKKIRSFFTWAGVVSIGSGILICSEIGKTAESVFQAGGSYDDMSRLWAVNLNMLFMIFDIVMGILLLKKKTTKMAYILAITELVYIVLVLVLGGTIGIGAIAFLLALAGAIRIDKKWKQYQEISGGSNQLNHTGNSTAGTTQNNTYTEIHTSKTANNGSTWQQAEKNNDFVSADSPKMI